MLADFGIGFFFHCRPAGVVKLSDGMDSLNPSVWCTVVVSSANCKWWAWKHSSVGAESTGQRRYAYPPPWLAVIACATSTMLPTCQTERSAGGNDSPVVPPPLPPETPQGEWMGAVPGERQGLSSVYEPWQGFALPWVPRFGSQLIGSPGMDTLLVYQQQEQ